MKNIRILRISISLVCICTFAQMVSCQHVKHVEEKNEDREGQREGVTEHTFETDVYSQLKVLWMGGENSSDMLICTINNRMSKSVLYRSTNGGEKFMSMTDILQSHAVVSALQSTTDNRKVILILNGTGSTLNQTILMSSNNSGTNFFGPMALPFLLKNTFIFHPSNSNFLLALGIADGNCNAYVSKDFGREWNRLQEGVVEAVWSPTEHDAIYLLKEVGEQKNDSIPTYELISRTVNDASVKILMQNVVSFFAHGKFLYVAVKENKSSNVITLNVTTSSGRMWNKVQFVPENKGQEFRFLDASSGMVFLYVGSESSEKESCGVIYTSDQDGILFSESLTNADVVREKENFFYKVQSVEGVYLSQQKSNGSSYSMITFNRGRSWQKIVFGEECQKSENTCKNLQITYDSVEDMSVKPLSVDSRYRLPLIAVHVHGEVPSDRQSSVYLTWDGGYTWKKTFSQPYFLSIANQGALLVAAPTASGVSTFTYSANEGQTWKTISLKKLMVVTNLLTQVKSWTSKVIVVSRNQEKTEWVVTIVSFSSLVGKQHCTDKDFDTFYGHGFYTNNGTDHGCILGIKEPFKKMKNSTWCLLKESLIKKDKSAKPTVCLCSPEDYECDFGFYRTSKGSNCTENPELRGKFLDICNTNKCSIECTATKTSRYRRIPGSRCKKGWDPGVSFGLVARQKFLVKECLLAAADSKMKNIVIAVIVMLVVVIVFTMVIYFIRKLQQLNKQEPTYRYSKLNQDETTRGVTSDDDSQETLVDISSEDEGSSPATLLVHSQTVSPISNGSALNSIPIYKTTHLPEASIKSLLEDDDDELLQ